MTLGGTPCFLPLPALHASFGGLECRLDDAGIGTCRIPPGEIRRNGLRGMREVDFAIGAGMVRAVTVRYLEMVDVEFTLIEQGLERDFGPPAVSPDSSRLEWKTDSLSVTFTPGRKPHWTRFGSTYTPVLLYRRIEEGRGAVSSARLRAALPARGAGSG